MTPTRNILLSGPYADVKIIRNKKPVRCKRLQDTVIVPNARPGEVLTLKITLGSGIVLKAHQGARVTVLDMTASQLPDFDLGEGGTIEVDVTVRHGEQIVAVLSQAAIQSDVTQSEAPATASGLRPYRFKGNAGPASVRIQTDKKRPVANLNIRFKLV